MEGHLLVTIALPTGEILFSGLVPNDDVTITGHKNKPTTATVKMPLKDATEYLRSRLTHTEEN